MKFLVNSRYSTFLFLTVIYSIPLLFFAFYSLSILPKAKSWAIISIGFLTILVASLFFFLLLHYWNKKWLESSLSYVEGAMTPQNKVTPLDEALLQQENQEAKKTLEENRLLLQENSQELLSLKDHLASHEEKVATLTTQLHELKEEKQKLVEETRHLENRAQRAIQDFSDYKLFSEEQLKQKNLQLSAAQQTISEQNSEIEKREEQVCQLNSKIHDLSYEIRTLIHLHEVESTSATMPKKRLTQPMRPANQLPVPMDTLVLENESSGQQSEEHASSAQVQTVAEGWALLRKCVHIAQRLTGANYYGKEGVRFREFSSSHFTIDQRRLFDSLKHQKGALILVYSQKEEKLLFANSQTRILFDCSAEKFLQEFASFFPDGLSEWKKALSLLSYSSESQSRLLAKNKTGSEIALNAHFAVIPTGLFRNYVICLLYPV